MVLACRVANRIAIYFTLSITRDLTWTFLHGSVVLLKYYPSSAASAIAAAAIVASHVGSVIAKVVWGVMAAGHNGQQRCSILSHLHFQ